MVISRFCFAPVDPLPVFRRFGRPLSDAGFGRAFGLADRSDGVCRPIGQRELSFRSAIGRPFGRL
jgi:hypothetical protein